MKKTLKNVVTSAVDNASDVRTTVAGVLTILSLFTPITPVVSAIGAAAVLIFGAVSKKGAAKDEQKP